MPSAHLDEFFSKLEQQSFDIYPPERTFPVRQDTESFGYAAETIEMRPVSRIKTYRPEYLKILLLDRRMPNEDYNKMARVFRRFTGSPRSHVESDQWLQNMSEVAEKKGFAANDRIPLIFRTSMLTYSPSMEQKGLELSLLPETDDSSLLLMDEMEVCWNSLRTIHKGLAYPVSKGTLLLPIVRLPEDSSTEQTKNFVSMVDATLKEEVLRLSFTEPTIDL
jgi:hypothetical protein